MISFACSSCGKQLKVKDEVAGKKVKCPGCGQVIAVLDRVPSLTAGASLSERPETPTLPPDAPSNPPAQGTIPPPGLSDATDTSHPHADQHDASLTDFLAPPQADGELGRLGGFRILKVLGAGGMGVVYQGEDLKLGRKVAIKAMLPHLADSKTSQQRFLREARTAAALEHDHIVAILQVAEDRGAPFIVMPFLKGEPLDVRLQREPILPLAEVLRIGHEMALGLGAAHAAGLVHRDIKPANVWLEGDKGRVKILDFGLARASVGDSGLTQQGAIIGTPAYMAPEQASGEAVDGRCDLFSLGCVLYRMATGQAAFKGKDTVSTLMSVAVDNPPPPIQLRPELPEALSDLVMQLLAKKPEERMQTAQAVVEALRQIEGETTQVLAAPGAGSGQGNVASTKRGAARTSVRRQGSKRSRLPWLIGGGVAGVCVLVAALVLLWPTPKGIVRIESDDPNVEIVFDKSGPTIKGADKEPIALRAGEHGILIKRGDFSFEADKLLIKKGETTTLRIELLGGEMQIKQDGLVIAAGSLPLPKTYRNKLGMDFVLVPRGKAWLGGGAGYTGNKLAEVLHDFYLGKYEVTQEEWGKVTANNPSAFNAVQGVAGPDQKRFPVEQVSWEDCQLFVKRLNEQATETGWVYRLPTEAEWEYACRGGPMKDASQSAFDFYLEEPTNTLLPDQANFAHDKGLKRTCKVGSYKPNALGLFDMHGNVWEWCDDEWKKDKGTLHYFRGGSWDNNPNDCRAGYHLSGSVPEAWAHRPTKPVAWRNNIGLRLARVPIGKPMVKTEAVDIGSDRKAAEWVLAGHGGMTIRAGRQERQVGAAKDLPVGAFELTGIHFGPRSRVTDDEIVRLQGLTNLGYLTLKYTHVGDAGLAHLKDLPNLTSLGLQRIPMTDAGLEPLKGLTSLTSLSLAEMYGGISGTGLVHLKELNKLEHIKLDYCTVLTTGLEHLPRGLTQLFLKRTKVNDGELVHLKELTKLTELCLLECSQVTGATLGHLPQGLTTLDLGGTPVTDAGLVHLRGLSKLKLLRLHKTKVTAAGIEELRKALPQCKIEWDGVRG